MQWANDFPKQKAACLGFGYCRYESTVTLDVSPPFKRDGKGIPEEKQ